MFFACRPKEIRQNNNIPNYLANTTWGTDKFAFESQDYKIELDSIIPHWTAIKFDTVAFTSFEDNWICSMDCYKNINGYYTFYDTNTVIIYLDKIVYDGCCQNCRKDIINMRNAKFGKYKIIKDHNKLVLELLRE